MLLGSILFFIYYKSELMPISFSLTVFDATQ